MTTTERWTVLISGLGLVFIVVSAGLGLIVRITSKWSRVETNLGNIADNIAALVRDNDGDHRELSRRIDKTDSRIERHEIWHDDHPYITP